MRIRFVLVLFQVIVVLLPLTLVSAQPQGEHYKINKVYDSRLQCVITNVDIAKKDSKKFMIEVQIKNISPNAVTIMLDDCPICLWSISVNQGDFFPVSCAKHTSLCRHRSATQLEPGEVTTKAIHWYAHNRCHGRIVYSKLIRSIRVRYLLKRIGANDYDVYIASNEFVRDVVGSPIDKQAGVR